MRPDIAYAFGALTVVVSQILFEIGRGLLNRRRDRRVRKYRVRLGLPEDQVRIKPGRNR